jgi:hypothetical protein
MVMAATVAERASAQDRDESFADWSKISGSHRRLEEVGNPQRPYMQRAPCGLSVGLSIRTRGTLPKSPRNQRNQRNLRNPRNPRIPRNPRNLGSHRNLGSQQTRSRNLGSRRNHRSRPTRFARSCQRYLYRRDGTWRD